MHRKLLEIANKDQLKEFAYYVFDKIKGMDVEVYDEAEEELYEDIYGCHFNEWLLDKALSHMQNEDGTTGPHWTIAETNNVARTNGITFDHFNEYDWNYVMNMIRSDYYKVFNDDTNTYIKLAKSFLFDKDAPQGKAYRYYISMKK